ncbi:MAG TPA: dihydrofolate reductase [Pseudolabrys sp.]|nr:dihydrofolate reductase [Pseudolabrys sp.]
MRSGKTVVLVAAVGENGVIGNQGALPWRLKSDLMHFKRLTVGKPVIMGRKTFESIGKALKDRTNIVLSRDLSLAAPGAVLATSMDAAFAFAKTDADKRGVNEIMVIGGSDVFEAAMEVADRLEITRVHASPEGDSYFPEIDPQQWREVKRERRARGPQDGADFTILTYERIR